LVIMHRTSQGIRASVPFGVFLSPAAIVCMIWGNRLIEAYFGLLR
jgi:prepilin signal peptidase PulO-like enzyme (type II secretory pathway)